MFPRPCCSHSLTSRCNKPMLATSCCVSAQRPATMFGADMPQRMRLVALSVGVVARACATSITAQAAGTRSQRRARLVRTRSSAKESPPTPTPFSDIQLAPTELQQWLRADIMRRYKELKLLGWLGRAYLAVPFVFKKFLPAIFQLSAYDSNAAACFTRGGCVDCTLREGSGIAGPKGIPFRLMLDMAAEDPKRIKEVKLLSIGCDLTREDGEDAAQVTAEGNWSRMSLDAVQEVCDLINTDAPTKRLVVKAITSTIFKKLSNVARAAKEGVDLEVCAAGTFTPREELWALEGTSYKWVQQVSGWYFAAARLEELRFESVAEGVRFTFYLDPSEPVNSVSPGLNVNPEVINCKFS
ncbi:unnamed protein product [Polarella glacialis]|uniref:Uncharacterized protein n=1 Tax=Polarella glacialis TaxID=89957 RepID=A0A813LDY4_POLGL|nr:unnamed protein product [Polarella glacialis]